MKYYIEVLYSFSNGRGIYSFESDDIIQTKTRYIEIKEEIKKQNKNTRLEGNIIIENTITLLNK